MGDRSDELRALAFRSRSRHPTNLHPKRVLVQQAAIQASVGGVCRKCEISYVRLLRDEAMRLALPSAGRVLEVHEPDEVSAAVAG